MDKLTKEEKSWLRKMQNLLDKCPEHFAFNTTGDNDVAVFDNRKIQEVYAIADERHGEFSNAIDEAGAHVGYLRFPNPVHSTSG